MALKATIYKIDLQVSDLDRHYYQRHVLTVARHPSETDERMMARVLAFACYADPMLEFGKGLSSEDEPDLWRKDLTGVIQQWIEVGLPDEKRLRRAAGRSDQVIVLSYGGRSADIWWEQNQSALRKLGKLIVIRLPTEQTQALADVVERTLQIDCTLQDGELWLVIDGVSLHVTPELLIGVPNSLGVFT